MGQRRPSPILTSFIMVPRDNLSMARSPLLSYLAPCSSKPKVTLRGGLRYS